MHTRWTRGAQPHSFQKRARATLARLELAALACMSEASSLPPKLKFSRTVQAENLRKTDNSAPLPTCTCCAVHRPCGATDVECGGDGSSALASRLSENECLGMRNYRIQNGSALSQRHRPSQETLCK